MMKKNLLKTVSIAALSMTAMATSPISANASWKNNSTGWWFTEDNSYAADWKQIDGTWYYFGDDGYMKSGWIKYDGSWYFFDNNGSMKTGWIKDSSSWYFLDNNGIMQAGWVQDGSSRYFLDSSGAMMTGWIDDNSSRYFLNNNGVMQTGWIEFDSSWYFLNDRGVMQTGWVDDNSVMYYLDDNGAMVTNSWVTEGIQNYFIGPLGTMTTGFYTLPDGNTFYFYKNGVMATNDLVDGYLINEVGIVSETKTNPAYSPDDAIKLINKEDSKFIKDFKAEQNIDDVELFMFSVCKSSYYLNSYNINSEIVYCIELINPNTYNNHFRRSYLYYVGATSGKVYCAYGLGTGKIYEIENNTITNAHTSIYNKKAPDWR